MFDSTSLDRTVVGLKDHFHRKDYIYILLSNCFVPARDFRKKMKFNAGYVFYCELCTFGLEVPHWLLYGLVQFLMQVPGYLKNNAVF